MASKYDVAVIMGSRSDLKVMKDAIDILKKLKISYCLEIVSAHRTPVYMQKFALEADTKGFKVIIAGAGGAAHLPGMVASLTTLPVIGVPVSLKGLNGLDSLLSIAQMPKGVPVATMAIDNSANAALFAARVLSLSSAHLKVALRKHQNDQSKKVTKMNTKIKKMNLRKVAQ